MPSLSLPFCNVPGFQPSSGDLARYLEQRGELSKPWNLQMLRLQKLKEAEEMEPEDHRQSAGAHADLCVWGSTRKAEKRCSVESIGCRTMDRPGCRGCDDDARLEHWAFPLILHPGQSLYGLVPPLRLLAPEAAPGCRGPRTRSAAGAGVVSEQVETDAEGIWVGCRPGSVSC